MSPYIRGEENQNLHKLLAVKESELCDEEFLEWLDANQEADKENFRVSEIYLKLPKETRRYSLVFGEHAKKRTNQRLWFGPDHMLKKCIEMLGFTRVKKALAGHPIIWDFESNNTIPWHGDGRTAVVVRNLRDGFVVVFEAGFNYILVVTIEDNPKTFVPRPTDIVIRVTDCSEVFYENYKEEEAL